LMYAVGRQANTDLLNPMPLALRPGLAASSR